MSNIRHSIRLLTAIDSYKIDHRRMYPAGTTGIYSNFTPRSSYIEGVDHVVFFGLQAFIQKYLIDAFQDFLDANQEEVVAAYNSRILSHIGPNEVGDDHIRQLHDLGYIPLRFNALPEGTATPLRVPMFTVENTHPDFFWLVNYIESLLSAEVWLPCTSATQAWRMRKLLDSWAKKTGGDPDFVNWQGHDFSFRGMEGLEAAKLSGAGHLISFTGSDTIPVVDWIEDYYPGENGLIGGSVPASEHSVMCAGGNLSERETFEHIIGLYPSGIVSIVADSWDLWSVCTSLLPAIKDQIMNREGRVTIRPDSGNPVKIVCGDADSEDVAVRKGVVELLWDVFGGTTNAEGYKVLDSHIGVIYGDSISYQRADDICAGLAAKGFASTNIVFGIGSFTYQFVTRDTFGFAMKATWAEIDGVGQALWKDPVTDDGVKRSAKGRLAVTTSEEGELVLINEATREQEAESLLKPVWENGKWLRKQSFDDVRSVLR